MSRFFYPTNSGSLGDSRRPTSIASPGTRPRSMSFASDFYSPTVSYRPPVVLVVEDDDDNLYMLRRLLGGKGYQVLGAFDGKRAIEIAETEELDLILLDLKLPGMDGLGVINRLRENPRLDNLPVLIMTAHEPELYRDRLINAGCDDFLVKPIDFDRLDVLLDYYAPVRSAA